MVLLRLFFLCVILSTAISGWTQCGPYVAHPIYPDSLGNAFVNLDECGPGTITGCLWDNGSTTYLAQDLAVGLHSVILFDGVDPVATLYFEVEQLHWELNQNVGPMGGVFSVSIWAELDYCGTQIMNYHVCSPDPDSTVVYLLQDGVVIDSLVQVNCPVQSHIWGSLPFGYTYQTYLVDHGSCGSYAYGDLVATCSLADATLDVLIEPATNGSNGSIEILAVVPDPNSTLPTPPSPITGTFTLFELPDHIPAGDQQTGIAAVWTDLPAGDFMVIFNEEDCISDPVIMEVTINISTGIDALSMTDRITLWPVPVQDVLFWSGRSSEVSVMDLQGRVVRQDRNVQQLDVSMLSPGSYILKFQNGVTRPFVKE